MSGQNQSASLDGPVAKVRRANVHFTQVVDAWNATSWPINTSPDSYSVEIGGDRRKHTYRAVTFPVADPEWGLVLGDCVHNLRSALDHLAWQLVLANGGTPKDGQGGTQFPITMREPIRINTDSGEVDPAALKLIDDVQPRHGGEDGDNLVLINDLDIMDKHHFVIVTAMAVGSWGQFQGPNAPRIVEKGRPDPRVAIKPGDVAAWFVYDRPMNERDPNLHLMPDVRFVEGPLAAKSFLELGFLFRWTTAFVSRFAQFF